MAGLILSLLCFWPLGIPALIFGMKVNSLWNQGDQAGALEAHQKASKFRKLAFIIGGIIWGLTIVVNLLMLLGVFGLAAGAGSMDTDVDSGYSEYDDSTGLDSEDGTGFDSDEYDTGDEEFDQQMEELDESLDDLNESLDSYDY
ncbi:CD225/dispanin family protein [Nocardiopsis halophila]|uniref:CD225/dispanin family protein n=1 Tax=Nocardiopsis halophila TaxID=141692 RepID=UPI00034A3220|nr:CD225/dispanin family protein [Nocardiopsis halophila]